MIAPGLVSQERIGLTAWLPFSVVHYQIGLFVMVLATADARLLPVCRRWAACRCGIDVISWVRYRCLLRRFRFSHSGATTPHWKAATIEIHQGEIAKTKKRDLIGFGFDCLSFMTGQQRTHQRIARGQWQLVHRGEDWRSAITFPVENASAGLTSFGLTRIDRTGRPTATGVGSETRGSTAIRDAGPYRFGGEPQPIGCGAMR